MIQLALAALLAASGLGVFDNGLGRGELTIDQQADLAKRTGYDGVIFAGTDGIPEKRRALESRRLKFYAIYTGMNLSDKVPSYDPGLPNAIRQLEGTGAQIAFIVNGKHADGDAIAARVISHIADLSAKSGLRLALYPHYGMHMATIEDALRLREMAGGKNIGIVFNLCHWLRSGDEPNLDARLKQVAPYLSMALINGADHEGDWTRLIQPLGQGDYDVKAFLTKLKLTGYRGPIILQCYGIKGDREQNLSRSIAAWKAMERPVF